MAAFYKVLLTSQELTQNSGMNRVCALTAALPHWKFLHPFQADAAEEEWAPTCVRRRRTDAKT